MLELLELSRTGPLLLHSISHQLDCLRAVVLELQADTRKLKPVLLQRSLCLHKSLEALESRNIEPFLEVIPYVNVEIVVHDLLVFLKLLVLLVKLLLEVGLNLIETAPDSLVYVLVLLFGHLIDLVEKLIKALVELEVVLPDLLTL